MSGWDFFISYTQADLAWAEWIAWTLDQEGYRVHVQAWDFVPGSNWVRGMQQGVEDSGRTVALLSQAYLGSAYGAAEWQAAFGSDPDGRARKLLPVRVADCERPGLLATIVGFDLFGLSEADAKDRLLDNVARAIRGTARPVSEPPFPGRRGRAVPRFPAALPSVSNLSARNPNFTGRDAELAELATALAAGSTLTVEALHGLGGVGKTQLASEYAHRHATGYDVIWQVASEEPAAIPDQFTALAVALGLSPAVDPAELRAQVHDELGRRRRWLLIFDNAERVAEIRPWLPAGGRGHAIVTTRRGGFKALGRVLELDVVDLPDAVALLRSRVPGLAQRVGEDIALELGRLPLALEQAAAYLDISQLPAAEYLGLLRERGEDVIRLGQVIAREDVTIATLWDISLDRIASESPAAVRLLEICAYLAPEPIPLDLFTGHHELLPEPLAVAAGDALAFNAAVTVCVDYSLAKRSGAGLQLHRLLQTAIRARTGERTERLETAVALLRADAPGEILRAPEAWPRWARLLPHVLAVTARPEVAAHAEVPWLLDGAALYLQEHARITEARPLAERALALTEAAHGLDHPEVAAYLSNLAVILRGLGLPEEALPLEERALGIRAARSARFRIDPEDGAHGGA